MAEQAVETKRISPSSDKPGLEMVLQKTGFRREFSIDASNELINQTAEIIIRTWDTYSKERATSNIGQIDEQARTLLMEVSSASGFYAKIEYLKSNPVSTPKGKIRVRIPFNEGIYGLQNSQTVQLTSISRALEDIRYKRVISYSTSPHLQAAQN